MVTVVSTSQSFICNGMCFTWAAFIDCLPLFRTSELQSRLSAVREQLQGAEEDLEEVQGERSAKYRELRKREDTMKGAAIPSSLTWEDVF